MIIAYKATGSQRKNLVHAIRCILETPSEYRGAPTFEYDIDGYIVDRDGNLHFSDRRDSEEVEMLIERLAEMGFCAEPDVDNVVEETSEKTITENTESEGAGLTVAIPLDKVSVGNLTKLLDAKGNLIKKALGINAAPVEVSEDAVSFPWFKEMLDADTAQAYTHFISALCQMSREQKRVTATEKNVENEKYAFRCFLLRLGFIGAEYKTERKILLKNLTGSSAFKNGDVGHAVSQ